MHYVDRLKLIHKIVSLLARGEKVMVIGHGFFYELLLRHFNDFSLEPDFVAAITHKFPERPDCKLTLKVKTGGQILFADAQELDVVDTLITQIVRQPPSLLLMVEFAEGDLKDLYQQHLLEHLLKHDDSKVRFYRP